MTFEYGLYSPGASLLHRLDPRAKIMWLAVALAFSIANDQVLRQPFLGLVIYLSLAGAILVSRVPSIWLKAAAALSAVFFATNLIFWPLYFAHTGRPLFAVPYINLTYTDLGLRIAAAKAFLVANPIMAAIIVATTTRPYHMLQALVKFRMPYRFVFILVLALRLIPVTISEVRSIVDAQMSRGLELQKGFFKRIRNFIPIFIPLMVRMLRGIVELGTSLDSKAFGALKSRTFVEEIAWRRKDTISLSSIFGLYLLASIIASRSPPMPPFIL